MSTVKNIANEAFRQVSMTQQDAAMMLTDAGLRMGQSALNMAFPHEFEVYLISLELCDWNDEMIDFLLFPVNPSSMTIMEPVSTNIIKTFGAVAVIKTDDFIPQTVSLSGSFGRGFKFLGGRGDISFYGITLGGEKEEISRIFNNNIKTGFGVTKVMQRICEGSRQFDSDRTKPRKLYLHNNAFSESYWVEVRNVRFHQALDTNMIWNYELELDILQKVSYNRKKKDNSLANNLIKNSLSKSGNDVFQYIKRTTNKAALRLVG